MIFNQKLLLFREHGGLIGMLWRHWSINPTVPAAAKFLSISQSIIIIFHLLQYDAAGTKLKFTTPKEMASGQLDTLVSLALAFQTKIEKIVFFITRKKLIYFSFMY